MKHETKKKIALYVVAIVIASATYIYNVSREPIVIGNIEVYANQSLIYVGAVVSTMFLLAGIVTGGQND